MNWSCDMDMSKYCSRGNVEHYVASNVSLTFDRFVCATSQETSDIVHLTSFPNRRAGDDLLKTVTIWEAARATSAAPSFFSPITLGSHGSVFVDGATGANNPVYELWLLAKDAFHSDGIQSNSVVSLEDNVGCIVSIGTGVPSAKAFGVYPTTIAKALLSMTTETEKTARRFARDRSLLSDGGRYYRFNVPNGLDKIAMEDSKSKNSIIAVTDRYLEDQETFKKVEKCSEMLREGKRTSQSHDECLIALSTML
jgi:predicted acylesterase/phospholipase RssA